MAKPIIESIEIKHELDDSPDLSFYGEYTDKYENGVITRHNVSRNEYKYFKPCTSYKEHWNALHKLGYSRGNCDYLARKYIYRDYNRMESYNNGNWFMMGIVAHATVKYSIGNGDYRLERFTSGGLWGIESDSDSKYINEIEQEQLDDLKTHLKQFDVNIRNFNKLPVTNKN